MHRRPRESKPATIDVQGVLGTFKVPNAEIAVEYVLTYAPLDGGRTANGQLLEHLLPVREAFNQQDLDFDQLLQRDLDDFRVSEEMVPYLLGETSSDPRFFPPIVAVIVPMTGGKMKELYPQCCEEEEEEGDLTLKVFKYGDVFSVKGEKQNGQLVQSLVDLCIHPTNAKLVIVDGQHRAMAMLATYRSKLNQWSGNPFQPFYQAVPLEISELDHIHLPVCIAYFPGLTEDSQTTTERHLTKACRKFFLDINRNARHPSQARQILLDDTDIMACFTRHLFNEIKNNAKTNTLQLHHTEYDNPRDRTHIFRPFGLTDVYTLHSVVRSLLLQTDKRVRDPMASSGGGGRPPQNNQRLQRELDLENVLTEDDKEQLGIEVASITQTNYPRRAEEKLRQCFDEIWGQIILNALNKLYPFSTHIEAVDTVIRKHEPYTGATLLARTALMEGQGLRHTLESQHDKDRERGGEKSDAEKGWEALKKIEEDFEKYRAKLYLQLSRDPDADEIKKVNRLFDCFRSNAFQVGLFMAFAYMKAKMEIDDRQEFARYVDRWISRVNRKFNSAGGVRNIMFDYLNSQSVRHIYKPTGGLTPADWSFCRYLILELLSIQKGNERTIIDSAKIGWREKLYITIYNRREKVWEPEEENATSQDDIDHMSFQEIVGAFKSSLDIDEDEIKINLVDVRKGSSQSSLENENEDEDAIDEMEDSSGEQ